MVNVTCVFDRNGHHPVMTETPPILIDEAAHCRYRDRAAAGYGDHDFLKRAVAERIVDRLDAVRRRFDHVIDVDCHNGVLAEMLQAHPSVDRVTAFDPSARMAAAAAPAGSMLSLHVQMPCPLLMKALMLSFQASACIGRMIFPG